MAVQTVQLMLVTTVKGQQVLTPVILQLKGIGTAAQAANPPITALQKNLNNFGTAISKSLSNIRGTIVGLGTAMAVIGSAQIFASTIREAIEFEKQMANVSTILQSSTVSLGDLKKGLLELDGSLGSSSEQAKALYQALSTGVEPAKAIQFVADTAKFAKANLVDLGQATLLIAGIMNTFGKEAGTVAHVTDVMSETIRAGAITGEQLVASLGTVVNSAAQFGISLEEVAAAMATMTIAMIPPQQASVALNQAILGFVSPSKAALKAADELNRAFPKLNIELSLAALKSDGLVVSMQKLAKVAEQDQSLITELFGEVRAMKGVLALTGEQMDFFTGQVEKNKTGVDGLTDSMHTLQQQSLSAQLETSINNINKALGTLWQDLINKLTPAIVSFSESLVKLIDDFKRGKLDEELYQIRDALIALTLAFTLMKLPAIITGFQSLFKILAVTGLGAAGIEITKYFGAWRSGILTTTSLLRLLGTTIAALLKTPIVGITVIVYGAMKAIEMLRLIGQLKEEQGDLALAQANAGDTAFKLAKQLSGLGVEIKWHLLNEPKYVEALIRKAQSIRQADAHVQMYTSSLKAAKDPLADYAGGLGDIDKAALKAAAALEKLDRAFEDAQKDFATKMQKGDSNVFEDLLNAQADYNRDYEAALKAQKAAHANNNDENKQLFDEARQQYIQSANAYVSAHVAVNKAVAKENEEANKILNGFLMRRKELWESYILTPEEFWQKERDMAMDRTKEILQKLIERHQNFISAVDDVMGDGYGTIFENLKKIALEKYGTMVTEIQRKDATMRAAILASIALLGQGFIKLGNIIGGTSGALMIGIGTFANNLIKALSEGMKKIQAFAVAAASAINIVVGSLSKSKESQMGGAIGSTIGGIAGGIIGSVVPVIGTAIGAMLGSAIGGAIGAGIGSAFAKDYSKEIKKFAASLGFWISQELSESIAETMEKMSVSADLAVLLNLDKVAEDLGVTTNNLNYFIAAFEKAIGTFQEGSTLFADVVADLDKTLPAMIEAGTDGLGRWNAELLAFIQRLQEAGIEVKALTDAINSQFAAASDALNELISDFGENVTAFVDSTAAAINKAIQASLPEEFRDEAEKFLDRLLAKNLSIEQVITQMLQKFPQLDLSKLIGGIEGGIFTADMIKNQADFLDYFTLITAEINKMLASGMSVQEVFSQLGGSIQILRDAAIDLGLRGDPAFRSLMALFRMMNSESAKTLGNLNTLMTAFNNLGLMTQKNFTTFENIFLKVFQKFNKDGHISRLELQAMVPTLAQLRANAAQYGYELDAATQAMIALAIKRGLLPEEMPVDPMVEFARVMREDVVPAVQELTATLATAFGIVTALDGQSIDITTSVTPTGNIDWTKWLNNPPSFQGITSPVAFTVRRKEQPMLVHQGEHVTVSPANSQTFLGREVEPIDVPINFVDYNTDQKIGEAVISLGVRNGTPFVVTKKGRRG